MGLLTILSSQRDRVKSGKDICISRIFSCAEGSCPAQPVKSCKATCTHRKGKEFVDVGSPNQAVVNCRRRAMRARASTARAGLEGSGCFPVTRKIGRSGCGVHMTPPRYTWNTWGPTCTPHTVRPFIKCTSSSHRTLPPRRRYLHSISISVFVRLPPSGTSIVG